MDESPEKFEAPVLPWTVFVSEYFREICVRLPCTGGGAQSDIFLTRNWFEMNCEVVEVNAMKGTHMRPSCATVTTWFRRFAVAI